MKFRLRNATSFLAMDDEYRTQLETLGFEFVEREKEWYMIKDQTSVRIRSLEDLMNFIKIWGRLVISSDEIIIYDGYLE